MGFCLVPAILVFIATLIAQSSGQLHPSVKTTSENTELEISCRPSDGINIVSAIWISAESMSQSRPPYLKASGSYVGQYQENCYWDQTEGVKSLCESYELCRFTPRKSLFGDCGYKMRLHVTYRCLYCESFDGYNSRNKRSNDEDIVPEGFQEVCKRIRRKNPTAAGASSSGGSGASGSGGSEGVCPNYRFVEKHMATGPYNTATAAATFAGRAHIGRQSYGQVHTETNTIYFVPQGVTMEYEEISNGQHCRFTKTATKYVCNYDRSQRVYRWVCQDEGQVYATHNKANGHWIGDRAAVGRGAGEHRY